MPAASSTPARTKSSAGTARAYRIDEDAPFA
jgi:hypothetical protein